MSRGLRFNTLPAHLADRVHSDKPVPKAKSTVHTGKKVNKTEARFRDQYLEVLKRTGRIRNYLDHESIRLRLAKLTSIAFDFPVITLTGHLEFYEVKGHWRPQARAKTKIAAEQFPFVVRIFQWDRKGNRFIEIETFMPAAAG